MMRAISNFGRMEMRQVRRRPRSCYGIIYAKDHDLVKAMVCVQHSSHSKSMSIEENTSSKC